MENGVKIQYFQSSQEINHYQEGSKGSKALKKSISQDIDLQIKQQNKKQNKMTPQTLKRRQKTLRNVINGICDKYFITMSKHQFQDLIKKSIQMMQQYPGAKNIAQFASAVVYYFYADLIGLYSTKQFCMRNSLNIKAFNKKYKLCDKFVKRISHLPASQLQNNECKIQQKIQRQITQILPENPQVYKKNYIDNIDNLTTIEAVDLIFDSIFKSSYFQIKRREIIEKIAQKYEETCPQIIEAMTWTDRNIQKLYYIVFYYFKLFGANIKFYMLKEAVEFKLGLVLKKEDCEETIKLFKKSHNQNQVNYRYHINLNQIDFGETLDEMQF